MTWQLAALRARDPTERESNMQAEVVFTII